MNLYVSFVSLTHRLTDLENELMVTRGQGLGERIVRKFRIDMYTLLYLKWIGASLVAQWLRICLPMQGTRVRALVWEDPTCRGATKPVSHNC